MPFKCSDFTGPTPFGLTPGDGSWYDGQMISLDGAPTGKIELEDVVEIIGQGDTGDNSAVVVRLQHPKRRGKLYACGDAFDDVTGSSFYGDAYGGDGVVYFAHDLDIIITKGLTAEGRHLCGLSLPHEIKP